MCVSYGSVNIAKSYIISKHRIVWWLNDLNERNGKIEKEKNEK